MTRSGWPEIFNSDQGSQFTSPRFIGWLQQAGVRIPMDGRGRWMDNVFIERLWRSLKYECVYPYAFETGSELRAGLSKWIGYYNADAHIVQQREQVIQRVDTGACWLPGLPLHLPIMSLQ